MMTYSTRILAVVIMVSSLWCLTDALNPDAVSNVLFCPDPGTPPNARRVDPLIGSFVPGVKVSFYCEFTYKLVGSQHLTCLVNGSWSDPQPLCEKFMCDELDALPPKNGKRLGTTFTIGSKLRFRCSSNYILIGRKKLRCKPDGQWSAPPPTCKHRCARVQCDIGQKCKLKKRKPTCVCRENVECTSKWDPVCGSDGNSYNNECIMKATACRNKKDIKTVKHEKCSPGDRCSIYPASNCRASFSVYYYNVSAGKCQHMIAGGCHPSGWNGFFLKDECKQYCEQDVCILKPESGPCFGNLQRWYYDAGSKTCETFKYGGCFGNENNFRSLSDCEGRCV